MAFSGITQSFMWLVYRRQGCGRIGPVMGDHEQHRAVLGSHYHVTAHTGKSPCSDTHLRVTGEVALRTNSGS